MPSDFTLTCPSRLDQTTRMFFKVPGVIFDFASFSFQVPICGSAARHAPPTKKQNASANPIVLIFMRLIEAGFRCAVNIFPANNAEKASDRFIFLDCDLVQDSE